MTQGNCVGSDPEPFHSQYNATLQTASLVCKLTPCPVMDECLQYALARMNDPGLDDPAQRAIGQYGVWGGTLPADRWRLLGRRTSRYGVAS